MVVELFAVEGKYPYRAEWMMKRGEEAEQALSYAVRHGDPPSKVERIEFRGLMPTRLDDTETDRELQTRLRTFATSVLWLHSLRPAPLRDTRWKGAVRWSLEPNGSDAPIVLAGEPSLREEVSSFYEKHLDLELVVRESRKRVVRTAVRNRSRTGFDIDLIDTGEGLSECLSVLTALAMVRRHQERGGPSILAIEEPGSHLHPDLQRALTDRICEVARVARPRIVLETHSETVLRTVMLNIVRGDLQPDDVAVYWVHQNADGRSVADRIRNCCSKMAGTTGAF